MKEPHRFPASQLIELLSAILDDLCDNLRHYRFTAEIIRIRFKPIKLARFHFGKFICACADHSLELAKLSTGGCLIFPDMLRQNIGCANPSFRKNG